MGFISKSLFMALFAASSAPNAASALQISGNSFSGQTGIEFSPTVASTGNFHVNSTISIGDATLNERALHSLLPTTPEGRALLASKVGYGNPSQVEAYEHLGILPLMKAGYTGKGVSYTHVESFVDLSSKLFRNVESRTETVRPNYRASDENVNSLRNNKSNKAASHAYACLSRSIGFDDGTRPNDPQPAEQIGWFGGVDVVTGPFVAPAHGVDFINTDFYDDSLYSPEVLAKNGFDWVLQDDDLVSIFENLYGKGVKVASMSWGILPLKDETGDEQYSDTLLFEEYPHIMDGVSNPVSEILSRAADNDLVFVTSSGNGAESDILAGGMTANLAYNDTGVLYAPGDALNTLSTGCYSPQTQDTCRNHIYVDAGNNYNLVGISIDEQEFTNPNITKVGGFFPNHRFGTTTDGRIKPDILSTFSDIGAHVNNDQTIYTENANILYDYLLPIYRPFTTPETVNMREFATSYMSPVIAAGVALLREARPDLNAHQIREAVIATGSSVANPGGADGDMGYGMASFEAALNYQPPDGVWGSFKDEYPSPDARRKLLSSNDNTYGAKSTWLYASGTGTFDKMKESIAEAGLTIKSSSSQLGAVVVTADASVVEEFFESNDDIIHARKSLKYGIKLPKTLADTIERR